MKKVKANKKPEHRMILVSNNHSKSGIGKGYITNVALGKLTNEKNRKAK